MAVLFFSTARKHLILLVGGARFELATNGLKDRKECDPCSTSGPAWGAHACSEGHLLLTAAA